MNEPDIRIGNFLIVNDDQLKVITAALAYLAAGSQLMAQASNATAEAKKGNALMSKPLTELLNLCLDLCPDPMKILVQSERTSCALVAESKKRPAKSLEDYDPLQEAYNRACIDIETSILCRE